MLVMDVYNSRFHRLYDNKDPLSQIMDRDDTFVYVFSYGDLLSSTLTSQDAPEAIICTCIYICGVSAYCMLRACLLACMCLFVCVLCIEMSVHSVNFISPF